MIYIFNENRRFDIQIQYIFKTLFKILGPDITFINNIDFNIKEEDLLIYYGTNFVGNCNTVQIKPAELFTDKYMSIESMPKLPLNQFRGNPIIYGGSDGEEPYIAITNKKIATNIDIIQSSFFMLTRYEEVILWDRINKDSHNRFPVSECIAYKENFLSKPIVNEYIEWLWEWISSFKLSFERKKWWGDKDFGASLTHDIDKVHGYIWAFNYLMNLENKYGFKSSFYFMSGGTSEVDNYYNISDEEVILIMNVLHKNGFEVGLHGSYNTCDDFNQMEKEKIELDKYNCNKIYGTRQHYLKFKAPYTWNIQEKLGLLYDTTLTFPSNIGFRCGICMPYKIFDITENRELNIYEIPLLIMDGTLAFSNYMNLDKEESIAEIKKIIDIVKKYRGVFTILWHNSCLDYGNWEGWKIVYERCLEYIDENNGTCKTGKEIISLLE